MSTFVIADSHLSLSAPKPMDIFGDRWKDHAGKMESRWKAVVSPEDTVLMPGDISWGLTLEDALEDLRFLDRLPGRKILGKGNHDFWWNTVSKMRARLSEEGMTTIDFLHNNAFETDVCVAAGTRGWYIEEKLQNTKNETDFDKIVAREATRLQLSLERAVPLREKTGKPIVVFFHFPPVYKDFRCEPLLDLLHRYGIIQCYYGHIHGAYQEPMTTECEGISLSLIAADYLHFTPFPVFPKML